MDLMMICLKIVHVSGAVFWAGSVAFMAFCLAPALRAAGPAGDKVLLKLGTATPFLKIVPISNGLTILAGLILYWVDSGHMNPEWMLSKTGLVYGIAGLFGIAAAMVGGAVTGRAANRLVDLLGVVDAAGGTATAEQATEIAATRVRLGVGLKLTLRFLGLALLGMVSARYIFI